MDQFDNRDYREGPAGQDPFGPADGPYQVGPEGTPPPGGRPPRRPRRPMSAKQKGNLKIVVLCLVCALIGGSVYPIYHTVSGGSTTIYTGDRAPTKVQTASVNTEKTLTPAEIYAQWVPSSVGITVDIVSTNIFGQTTTNAAAGSGFVITEDGYILTNYHVINGASSIEVAFVDGKTYPAKLVGGEEANDIAVIKIEATGLKPVVLGKSSDMLVGESVVAIGNPLGELTFSESSGIISALNRTITMSDGREMNMIQTDSAINSGNSGGPLFNDHGEVIGIVSAKYTSGNGQGPAVEGLGFAIPIDDVSQMVSELVSDGYVKGKPTLGILGGNVDQAALEYGVPQGAAVLKVVPDLCSAKGGIQDGDIITAVNGEKITTFQELVAAKNKHKPGDTLEITVYRGGETLTKKVKLDESTPETDALQDEVHKKYEEDMQKEMQQQQKQQAPEQVPGGMPWPFDFGF